MESTGKYEEFNLSNINVYFNNSKGLVVFKKTEVFNFSIEISETLEENVNYKILITENDDNFTPLY